MNSFKGITTLSPKVKVAHGCAEAANSGLKTRQGQDPQLKSQTDQSDWTGPVYLNHIFQHLD